MAAVVRSVCPKDCPDTCGMLTHVENGRVVRVTGDPEHPITRGWLCGRYQHWEEVVHHPDRLLHPLVRGSKRERLRRADWDEALGTVADRFRTIAVDHGGQAILPYHYLAHMGVVSSRYGDRLWNRLGTARVGMEICAMAGAEAVIRVFGRIRGTEPEHLGKTRMYVAWGRNTKATNVHAWPLVKDIHPFVAIDPFRSETAAAADLHVQPRPGTDSMLAIGILRALIESDRIDHAFLRERTVGYEALRERVLAVPLGHVVAVTDVAEATILELARLYAEHRPGLIHLGVGLQRNTNGGEMVAAISMLAAVTGQVGTPGGGVLYANFDWAWNDVSHPELRADGPVFHNMIRLGRDLTESDAIRALYVYGSNPAATAPNQTLVLRGLEREDLFVVVHDLFLTDTAQRANVVLPATSYAETLDLHRSYWHDHAQVNVPAIAPVGEARSNSWVFRELARRLGFDEPCLADSDEDVIREALLGTGLEYDALAAGPVRVGDAARTSFDDGRFPTPSGKLELVAPTYTPPPTSKHRYRLATPKSRHLQGSQVFNLPRTWARVREPLLHIHPSDAATEGIAEGAPVRVWNERGEVLLTARLSDAVRPGLVVSHMVRWGPNANATTSDEPADMGGNSTFHTNYVSLEPA
jgi:anaerobic selenocysteine-containing dehydrogenase